MTNAPKGFAAIFPVGEAQSARSRYLARVLGLFSEDIVTHWCRRPDATYENLGRPTLWKLGGTLESRGTTLDFALRRRADGKVFMAEQKCFPAWDNGRAFSLESTAQLERAIRSSGLAAFTKLREFALDPQAFAVRIKGKQLTVDGAILIWGAVTTKGRTEVQADLGFTEVLSLEEMLLSLHGDTEWGERIVQLRDWSLHFFDQLA